MYKNYNFVQCAGQIFIWQHIFSVLYMCLAQEHDSTDLRTILKKIKKR